jgi:hypothetical protein
MQISVTVVDRAELEALVHRFDAYPAIKRKAISSAVNRSLSAGRTLTGRRVREELNLKAKDVREQIALRAATEAAPYGSITISRKPVPLAKFGATQTKAGVHVVVRRRRGPEQLPHAFLATMKSGHTGVFVRTGPYVVPGKGRYAGRIARRGPRKGQPILRQQIKEVFGPTVVGVIAGKPGLLEEIASHIGAVLLERMRSQISRFFGTT